MTVFIRGGSAQIEDDVTPQVPRLADLTYRLHFQPADTPLCIDQQTYTEAEKEMLELRRRRGFDWIETASLPQRNFLLFGFPIVCGD